MPIFQVDLNCDRDDSDHPLQPERKPTDIEPIAINQPPSVHRRLSEESLPTELCEGPLLESPQRSPYQTPEDENEDTVQSRVDLIERLKRAQSPTWIPNRHLQLDSIFQQDRPISPPPKPPRTPSRSSNLLPAAQITPEKANDTSPSDNTLHNGLNIQRPRSALHSGDFTNPNAENRKREDHVPGERAEVDRPPQDSWLATSPPRGYTPFQQDHRRASLRESLSNSLSFGTSPAPLSSSFSSSFVYQPPTSPLVQSESNDELDFSEPLSGIDFPSDRLSSVRHAFYSNQSSPLASPSPSSRGSTTPFMSRFSHHRRQNSFPYQAHQPRRSLTSTPSFTHHHLGTSPQTPAMIRSRRMSIGSDCSPIQQHASMVGSYEESILRGRMSTTPSKPLDFMAQIGVLGMGKCKASLKCPPHVTLPFPAVYYSYSSTPHGRSQSDDGPSPYVGQIDLENGLPSTSEDSRSRRKAHVRIAERKSADGVADVTTASQSHDSEARQIPRSRRKSASPRSPPGGSYRIPEKGQIQIVIKNQNKTAVKLFLVPYDLEGMEPGTKTFIRQRSYSAGPIIDGVPNHGGVGSADRPTLRYLVHLHICCPAKGRFYLYKSIRLVFANRVPDGKEKLKNETTWPEPRFAPYKPIRVMHPPLSSAGPGAVLAADKAFRRRSSGFPVGHSSQAFDMMDGVFPSAGGSSGVGLGIGRGTIPIDPVPFRLPAHDRSISEVSDKTNTTGTELQSPRSSQASRPSTKDSQSGGPWDSISPYTKLSKGDIGYGGTLFSPPGAGPTGGTESLLSRRLRSLGVKPENQDAADGDSFLHDS